MSGRRATGYTGVSVPFGLEAYGGNLKDAIKFLGDLPRNSVVFDPSVFSNTS